MSDIEDRVIRLEKIARSQGADFSKFDTPAQAAERAKVEQAGLKAEQEERDKQRHIAEFVKAEQEKAEAEKDAAARAEAEKAAAAAEAPKTKEKV